MMTRKREMAEWILDFFRRSGSEAGQIILFRVVQNSLDNLTSKERALFLPVVSELMENGYFTYEDGASQILRLTQKGFDYIYDQNAVLDCCYDTWKPTRIQEQYLTNWLDSFENQIRNLIAIIDGLLLQSPTTDEDKKALRLLKVMFLGPEVQEIEKDLAAKRIRRKTLDTIANLNKSITDICLDHIQTSVLVREFFRQMSYLTVEREKDVEMERLNALRIPVEEG